MCLKSVFVFGPYLVFLVTFAAFVLRCRLGVRAQAIWAMVLLACFSKFLCYREFGGDAFTPELPETLIWVWNWAYSGAFILGVLSVATVLFRMPWRVIALPLIAWALSAWGVWNGIVPPGVHEITLAFDGLPASLEGYRIVQLTDLHVSSAARAWRTERIVATANACQGDIIVLTGDLVDGNPRERLRDVKPLSGLRARDGAYAVTGNHEGYFDFSAWAPWYARWGIRFLSNECAFPHAGLALGGVDDEKLRLPHVGSAFADATNGAFRVLLQHRPCFAAENARTYATRLQLSGHTHGGIFPGMSWFVKRSNHGFVRGLYRFNEKPATGNAYAYVSPGAGQWAGFPIRFFNPTEITVITLTSSSRPSSRPSSPAPASP